MILDVPRPAKTKGSFHISACTRTRLIWRKAEPEPSSLLSDSEKKQKTGTEHSVEKHEKIFWRIFFLFKKANKNMLSL